MKDIKKIDWIKEINKMNKMKKIKKIENKNINYKYQPMKDNKTIYYFL